jgi:hypothetical protein
MKLRRHTRSEATVKSEEASNNSTFGNDIERDFKEEDSNGFTKMNQANTTMHTESITDYHNVKIKQEDTTKFEIKLNTTDGNKHNL